MAGSFNHWGRLAANIKPACKHISTETALAIAANVQANAPVRSGWMRDTVYTVTPDGSTYGQAGSPPGDSYLLPEVQPENDTSCVVGVAANYSQFVELGTRFMPAQPFFYPAMDAGNAEFEANLSQFETLLKSGIA